MSSMDDGGRRRRTATAGGNGGTTKSTKRHEDGRRPAWEVAERLRREGRDMVTREEAHELLCEYTKSPNLRKHAYAVEAAMHLYAEKLGGDPEEWGVVGLLHDFDYERWPQAPEHPAKGAEILRERGYPEHIVRAVQSHASYTGLARETPLEKALFAVDELTGFVVAVALVRPTKSIMDVAVKSVKKKMKDKAFAAAVSREDITKGAEALGIPLDEHIANVVQAMQGIAEELGLAGSSA